MSVTIFDLEFLYDGALTNATSAVITITRTDTDAVLATSAAMTNVATGNYQYSLTDPAYDLTYSYSAVFTYASENYTFTGSVAGTTTPTDVYGFVTLSEAATYFDTRIGASTYWATGVDKEGALQTAYNDLIDCGLFDFTLDSGEDNPQEWLDAQCEQALFLLQTSTGLDARMNLQAQGVTQANVVGETYRTPKGGIPIAPRALQALNAYMDETDWQFTLER